MVRHGTMTDLTINFRNCYVKAVREVDMLWKLIQALPGDIALKFTNLMFFWIFRRFTLMTLHASLQTRPACDRSIFDMDMTLFTGHLLTCDVNLVIKLNRLDSWLAGKM